MRYFILASLALLLWSQSKAQYTLKGKVFAQENNKRVPMASANVYLLGTNLGSYTDTAGNFSIAHDKTGQLKLVSSFVGFKNDTQLVSGSQTLEVVLKPKTTLSEFEVAARKSTTSISKLNALKVENMGESELKKAPCCNLSESFETNPSIDVAFTDAVTGTKQIQMLGLAGYYSLISKELIPDVRLIGSIHGLGLIPGPWLQSIQVSKGTGTVKNGTESMTGQINYELKKPQDEKADKLFLNGYWNQSGRAELNAIGRIKVNERIHSSLFVHGNIRQVKWDMNGDRFLDNPLQEQFQVLNRWHFQVRDDWEAQAGIWYTSDAKEGGMLSFSPNQDITAANAYGLTMNSEHLSTWIKTGGFVTDKTSLGFQLNYDRHDNNSLFGLNRYNGKSESMYANAMLSTSVFGNNELTAGITALYDQVDESLFGNSSQRNELTVGPFAELNYQIAPTFSVLTGVRLDYHNNYGEIFTPRVHLKWQPDEKGVARLSVGRASRTPNMFADNFGFLASSRRWFVNGTDIQAVDFSSFNTPYGLERESSWNFGANYTRDFILNYRDGYFSFDLYHFEFENRLIADVDVAADELHLYNLKNNSTTTSFQATVDYELIKFLDVRLAYRYTETRTKFLGGEKQNPLIPRHRGFVNVAYSTYEDKFNGKWIFDATAQWIGTQRMPGGLTYKPETSDRRFGEEFFLINAQVTRTFTKKFELYVGVENLTDFKQANPIIDAENPFGNQFDATQIWGPIFGRMIYTGFRLSL